MCQCSTLMILYLLSISLSSSPISFLIPLQNHTSSCCKFLFLFTDPGEKRREKPTKFIKASSFVTQITREAMEPLLSCLTIIFLSLPFLFLSSLLLEVEGATFTFVNNCGDTVWPGVLSNAGSSQLETTGFELPAAASRSFQAPTAWSGRFWARTGCNAGENGALACATGDCGTGLVECNGNGAAPPATLAEFTLAASSAGKDFYDVSLVDGYNLPMVVEASGVGGGGSGCAATGCVADLNQRCPPELRVGEGEGQACRSACEAFGKPEYCCSGAYASPATCQPSVYSQVFKAACPRSYSYAYDDPTSTFTCSGGADYTITICPGGSAPSQKSSSSVSTPSSASSSSSVSSSSSSPGSDDSAEPGSDSASGSTSSTPKPAGGVMLQDDSWLASMATGDASAASRRERGERASLSLLQHQVSLMVATASLMLLLL